MQYVKNNKIIQIISTFWTWVIFYPLCKNQIEIYVLLLIHVAALINLYLLEYGLKHYIISSEIAEGKKSYQKSKMSLFIMAKFLILLGAIIFGVQLIGNRVIIAVINYVLIIFTTVLFLHVKNKSSKSK